jgi:hypothetical protein
MTGLTTALLGRVCRTFLTLAYPSGPASIPPAKRRFLELAGDEPLEPLLVPPLCEVLCTPEGALRGYALRLGREGYPHLKLQVIGADLGVGCVFAVDTHDTLRLEPGHPDAERWQKLQAANCALKEQIERAWDEEGVLTFNGLLRRELNRM